VFGYWRNPSRETVLHTANGDVSVTVKRSGFNFTSKRGLTKGARVVEGAEYRSKEKWAGYAGPRVEAGVGSRVVQEQRQDPAAGKIASKQEKESYAAIAATPKQGKHGWWGGLFRQKTHVASSTPTTAAEMKSQSFALGLKPGGTNVVLGVEKTRETKTLVVAHY
jgi:hypothetical protein